MIFFTQHQFNLVFIFLFFGILFAFIFILFSLIFLIKFQKILIKYIFYTLFSLFFCIFFIILLNYFNFGIFSLTLALAYCLSFFWFKKLSLKTVVIFETKWYNLINNVLKRLKLKLKRRTKNELHRKN